LKTNLSFLFKYLSDKEIRLDNEEFDFQFKSHPDYPSLLALSDTLTFFNIGNGSIRVDSSKLELLPESFIAILDNGSGLFFSYVSCKKNSYTYTNKNGQTISRISINDFKKIWKNIVLLIVENENITTQTKRIFSLLYFITFIIVSTFLIINSLTNLWIVVFWIILFIGFILSIFSLKEVFNVRNGLFSKLCNTSTSFSCDTVINSSQWKILEKFSFNDLSLIFFTTQIIALFFFTILGKEIEYFTILKFLLFLSAPIVFLSIYYQKYVVNKWCPICLLITAILGLELFFILKLYAVNFYYLTWDALFLFFIIYITVLTVWYPLKQLLLTNRDLREVNIKYNRFKRNYSLFKNTLLASEKYKMPESPLTFGNINSPLKIDFITSPFCRHCEAPHKMLNEMLNKYGDNIAVKIIFFIEIKKSNDDNKNSLYRNLVNLHIIQGNNTFNEALSFWLKEKNYTTFLLKYNTNYITEEIDLILNSQYKWCLKNEFNFTPCLFINGYRYPINFEISDLPYYINEIIDDDFFANSNKTLS